LGNSAEVQGLRGEYPALSTWTNLELAAFLVSLYGEMAGIMDLVVPGVIPPRERPRRVLDLARHWGAVGVDPTVDWDAVAATGFEVYRHGSPTQDTATRASAGNGVWRDADAVVQHHVHWSQVTQDFAEWPLPGL